MALRSLLPVLAVTGLFPAMTSAIDIRFSVPDFNRGVTVKDNGNIRVEGRVFANLSYRPYIGGIIMEDQFTNEKGAFIDNHIFLMGSVFQNQTSFPGKVKWMASNGTTIASVDENGNLYVRNVIEHVTSCVEPVWEGWKWNRGDIQFQNNCYNYANNQITFSLAEPGNASNYNRNGQTTVTAWRNAALSDGLMWVGWNFPGNTYTCPNAGSLIYLTVDDALPKKDYHWYRLDKANGKWTHKMGGTPATDLDASGSTITNPLTANRNYGEVNYTDNGGFYCTCGSDANVY